MLRAYDEAKKLHPDIDEWSAETVFDEFPDVADAILAGSACEETDEPWENPVVFEKVALVINDRPLFADMRQLLSAKEITYAVDYLKKRYPEDNFNADVAAYIASTISEEGLVVMPEQLQFVQGFIPFVPLDKSQEAMQELYLREIDDYLEVKHNV